MNGLTKLGTILTVVFLVSLLALVAELIYLLWRRQTFRRRTSPFYATPSKEQLLYLFCRRNHSRVEPAGNPHVPEAEDVEAVAAAVVVVDDDLAKWQQEVCGFGPSRVLFTIKEEEREGTETETDNEVRKSNTVRFEAESESSTEAVVVVVKTEDVDEATTPFSTPCASPPYYTPSPSPTHDKSSPGNEEGLMMSEGENDTSFVSSEVCAL